MDEEKFVSLAKGMRYLPFVFVVVFLVAGFFAAFYRSGDPEEKWGTLAFLALGLFALLSGTIGHCVYAMMWKLKDMTTPKEEEEESLEG